MKKIKLIYITLFLLCLTISCTHEKKELIIEVEQETNIVGLAIKDIFPLPNYLHEHTARVTGKINSHELTPNIDESFMVSYQDSPIQAIYTPLNQKLKSSIEIFHIYFELEGMVSKFHLLISQEQLHETVKRFTYKTIEGRTIVQFDVETNDGRIIDIQLPNLKNWGDRFENCVEWTFDQMSGWEKLGCMALGPYCAGTIAAMCGVGASEGMFETPDGP